MILRRRRRRQSMDEKVEVLQMRAMLTITLLREESDVKDTQRCATTWVKIFESWCMMMSARVLVTKS